MDTASEIIGNKDWARTALRLIGMAAIVFVLDAVLDAYRLASLLLGLFAIEFLARKQGFQWDETGKRTTMQSTGVVALGFGLGAFVVLSMVGVAWLAGYAQVSIGSPTMVGLGLGLVTPVVQAARDELLFRAAPLTLLKKHVPDRFALPFVALLGSAPLWLHPTPSIVGIGLTIVTGWIFALAIRMGKGILLAWGMHAGWLFMLGAGIRGSVFDVSLGSSTWLPFAQAQGAAAWIALVVVVLFAVGFSAYYLRTRKVADCPTVPIP